MQSLINMGLLFPALDAGQRRKDLPWPTCHQGRLFMRAHARLRAELDAWYARAYGLTRDELRYILDPADVKGRLSLRDLSRAQEERDCAVR
jgi:hypothetical protein